jgi:type II secretory pathway pseudopilin PulG
MDARVVKLGPENSVAKVIAFDQAFEEHSEARGRGRARRQRRRMERIENRSERRSAKRQARAQAQAERQAIRSERQASRQANRMQRKSARLERRMAGAEARAERRKLRNPEEEMMDESNLPPVSNEQLENQGAPPSSLPPDGATNNGQYEGQGEITEGSNVGEGSYPDSGSEQSYPSQEDAGYGDSEDSGYSEDSEDEGDYADSEEEGDEEYGFDGVMGAEDRYVELSDNDNIQRINVSPEMIDLANKYEWNKELVCRLIAKKADATKTPGTPTKGIEEEIATRKNRMSEIKSSFDNYLKYISLHVLF